jgi:asparagine synthase (glutamine-hydrolysing)
VCGIAGIVAVDGSAAPAEENLRRMLSMVRHRGPDGAGFYLDRSAALGHARLAIVDPLGGLQPIANEDGTIWVACNGEVFNHRELRRDLIARGHRFRTGSDTEVIVHLYEERGPECVLPLNGDFAFAVWDAPRRRLLLARDRIGVRPLYFTAAGGRLLFASEVKALLAHPGMQPALDLRALRQTFTYWSPLPGRSMFQGIDELPPGHLLTLDGGRVSTRRYWRLRFRPDAPGAAGEAVYADRLRDLLADATRLRLRADVPVGAYLSGGLDSAAITALAAAHAGAPLRTFSVAFADRAYDERPHQEAVARALGVEHRTIEVTERDIGAAFPAVVWHAETALLRSAPVPMFLLSRCVRAHGLRVVLTGEGADEFLGGYDIFKEAKIRRFWARQPASRLRPRLLRRLYDDVHGLSATPPAFLAAYFGQGLAEVEHPAYSHLVRWRSTARLQRFFSPDVRHVLAGGDDGDELAAALAGIEEVSDPLLRAQHVEAAIFLPQYLLSSQGDRVALAHAVEGRFPFLDHRVVEFCNRLPPKLKLRGLAEKPLLRRAVAGLVPAVIAARPKRPYRAPITRAFLGTHAPAYVREALAPPAVAEAGYFDPVAVARLVEKGRRAGRLSEPEAMALCGILSVQLLHDLFCTGFARRIVDRTPDLVRVAADRPAAAPAPVA